jgi:tripartite-type tricarboxylate transporter receptor subunit TctC
VRMLGEADMKERLATLGFDPVGSTPEGFATRLKTELALWRKVIRAADIKPM